MFSFVKDCRKCCRKLSSFRTYATFYAMILHINMVSFGNSLHTCFGGKGWFQLRVCVVFHTMVRFLRVSRVYVRQLFFRHSIIIVTKNLYWCYQSNTNRHWNLEKKLKQTLHYGGSPNGFEYKGTCANNLAVISRYLISERDWWIIVMCWNWTY